MTPTLRSHQQDAIEAVAKEFDNGVQRTAVVHPTGLGKGHLIAKLATDEVARGGRVLVLAHREEILDQIGERCRLFDPAVPIGRVQGSTNQTRRPITTAMIQTLGRSDGKRRGRMAPPTLTIVDECHRVMAQGYQETINWAGCFQPDGSRLVGLTATFVRGDRRGLGDIFESVAHKVEIAWAITNGPNGPCAPGDGWLVRPHGKVVVADHMDLNKAKISKGDYQDGELGEMVSRDAGQIVADWHKHAADRRTVAFLPTVRSAHDIRDEFVRTGVAAEVVTGKTPRAERNAIYARHASGETQVLVNVFVLVEGWDQPSTDCILMARPTRLPGVYMQAIGRGMRRHPGKRDCLILDVVGASRHQKLVTLVDLVPSSEYDTEAIDDLPCEQCELPLSRAAALRLGLGKDSPVCMCSEGLGRDPDGGRRKLIGPAVYEDLDLLLQTSAYTWLQTYAGTPFLPGGGDRMAVLWLDPGSDLYIVGHCAMKGLAVDGKRLGEGLTLDEARRVAEEWATLHGLQAGLNTHSRKAGWRKTGGATPDQLKWARDLRIPDAQAMSKAELSDAISVGRASRMIDRRS